MVLWRALRAGQDRRLPQQLPIRASQERQDADAYSPGRSRYDRPFGPEPGALPRAETLRSRDRIRYLSPRASWPPRGEAYVGHLEPHAGLVRQAPEAFGAS